jgi:glycerol-3-phosphate acyltransferase PlsY
MAIDPILAFPAAAALGYLLGSIPFGLVIVKSAGLGDIRTIGSGNIGATNVLRTGRKDLALATFLLDSGKAGLALALARYVFGEAGLGSAGLGQQAGFAAGAAAFLGHCFPIWLGFKGGKGVATFFGVLLTGLPLVGLGAGALWILTALATRISSFSALVAAMAAPLVAVALKGDVWSIGFCALLAALIFWRHRPNIERLLKGEEPRIGDKSKAAEPAP